jgi:hypothetical protein
MSSDERAYVFHGTVTVAAILLWLRGRSSIPAPGTACHRSPE